MIRPSGPHAPREVRHTEHEEHTGRWRRIWASVGRALSLTILGKSSYYHAKKFNASDEYWDRVLAGQRTSPPDAANPSPEIPDPPLR